MITPHVTGRSSVRRRRRVRSALAGELAGGRGAPGEEQQAAGHLVDQLERAGCVRRVPDPDDARARLVRMAGRVEAVRALARRVQVEGLGASLSSLREFTDPWR